MALSEEERKRAAVERTRQWRLVNPERARELSRNHMRQRRALHPAKFKLSPEQQKIVSARSLARYHETKHLRGIQSRGPKLSDEEKHRRQLESARKTYRKHRAKQLAYSTAYNKANRVVINERRAKWRVTHKASERARECVRRRNIPRSVKEKKAAYMVAWRAANKERIRSCQKSRYVRKRAIMNAQQRAHRRARSEEWIIKNRAYQREWSRQRRRAHPDLFLEAKHRRRARKHSGPIVDCKEKIAELLGAEACHWCLSPFSKGSKPTIDHVVALADGGSHTPDNLVAACRRCNFSKGSKRVEEWACIPAAS